VCLVLLLSVRVKGLGSRVAEFRGRRESPQRVVDMRVAQVGRAGGHAPLHLRPGAIAGQEGPHRDAVAQGMQAGASARGHSAQAALACSLHDGPLHAPPSQWCPPFRAKEPQGGWLRPPLVTAARRRVQDLPGRRGQRHAPRFAKLGLTHRAAPVGALHIRTVQRPRLTPPHARHGQSTQECGVGGRAETCRRGEWACGSQQVGDLLLTINGGGLPPIAGREQLGGRHLGPGVERAAVLGKAADHPESCGPMGGFDARRLRCPAQGEVCGEPEGPLPCGTVDELPQRDLGGLQRTPQRAPEGEGLREGSASWTQTAPPGQGWASAPQVA
jgi:hypothetical protein